MRPVNLIPPEERRGTSAPMRTGRTPYVLLGTLAIVIGAVALMVSTANSLDTKKAELAALEVERQDAQARADALRPFAQFAAAHETRAATVESLARSRFDWERVLDELSRVVPGDIWLVQLAGSASPEVSLAEGPNIAIRSGVAGPALELIGCGRTHESVAGFLAALRDIDGVTRVTAAKSQRPEAGKAEASPTSGSNTSECRTRDHVSQFEIVVAFDEVVPPSTEGTTPAPAAPAPAPAGTDAAPAPAGTDDAPAPAPPTPVATGAGGGA